jgi:integrase
MAKALTATAVRNARSGSKRREIPDGGCQGLFLIVQLSGVRSWALRYRFKGRTRKLTLGPVLAADLPELATAPALNTPLSLAGARELAVKAMRQVRTGVDPGHEKLAGRKGRSALGMRVRDICEAFLEREGGKLRSIEQRRYDLRLISDAIGAIDISDIRRSHIVAMLDRIEAERGPTMADRVLGAFGRLQTWHASRGDDFRPVIVRGMKRSDAKARARTRVLTDDEIRALWEATASGPFGGFVRFALLTATRRNEAAGLRRSELVDTGTWIIPKDRYKTGVDHVVPLSPLAQSVIAAQPNLGDAVFSIDGAKPITGFDSFKKQLDAASGVTGWRIHDIRRTARTLLSRCGIDADIAERALGHATGGVRGVYDRYAYAAEKRHAFEALARRIEAILHPSEDKVVRLRGGRQ